jgi:hypothetical protein
MQPPLDDRATFNPYLPPAAPGAFAPPQQGTLPGAAIPLYTANQVALAAFLGTPLGGAVVIASNERRLGRPRAALLALGLGVLALAALAGIALLLPDGVPSVGLGWLPVLAIRAIAQKRQRALVDAHLAAGGRRASSWAAAGIGLACLVAAAVSVFAIAIVFGVIG